MKVSTYIISLLVACGVGGIGLLFGISYYNYYVEKAQDEVSAYALTKQELAQFTHSFDDWMLHTRFILGEDQSQMWNYERAKRKLVDSLLLELKSSKLGQEERLPLSEIEQFIINQKIRMNGASVIQGDRRREQLRAILGQGELDAEGIVQTLDLLDGRLRTRISASEARHASAIQNRTIVLWVMVLSFVALIITAWRWTSRTISAPLRKLSREAKEAMAQGTLVQKVKVAPQEILTLSRSFSDLVGKMDGQVRKRTAHLAKANKELDKARIQAEAANEAKSEFLTNVSHELRTPLSSIRASADILYQFPDEEMAVRLEFAEIILLEAERLTRLIDNVLDLGKIQSGHEEWREDPVQVADTLFEVVRARNVESTSNGVEVSLDVAGRLPTIYGDRDRLKQLWTNLIGNAMKFSSPGDQVEVLASQQHDLLVVTVQDYGPGIRPEDLDVIFDRFRQVSDDTLTDKPHGTGLGLAIAKQIAERHGAQIHVESVWGEGSTFSVMFPVRQVDCV